MTNRAPKIISEACKKTGINMLRAMISVMLLAGAIGSGYPANAASPNTAAVAVNRGVIQMETGAADGISIRMAAEIGRIIDDGATRRVIPIIGRGPLQNLIDLKYLRGIDLAIIQVDALDYARQQKLLSGLDSLTYVAKLHNEEFHLLARADIRAASDLSGQRVNVDLTDSSTAFTAARLFELLQIKPQIEKNSQQVALEKLRKGEIAAVAFVTAKPTTIFQTLRPSDHFHFLNIPLTPAISAIYAPGTLTAVDYPNLVPPDQPIETIAVGNVLMAADLHMLPERDRNLRTFVDTLYSGFQTLSGPGYDPKWRDINIAADIPGWTRNASATAWLRNNPQIAAAPDADTMKDLFSRFIDEHRQATGGSGVMSASEKNALFQQFETWQRGQSH
ncbi:MAG TPA: TAXI family TRAP transporter solute-binding subunit [Stellaceae bacterium]|jgi:TRAP-type uncharacterized transport system substrate-binding protein|nr:TAXI family TRAP transporter solute-binding subunit [Stellaceae bacterium]